MLGVVAYLASRLEELRSSGDMEGALAMMAEPLVARHPLAAQLLTETL